MFKLILKILFLLFITTSSNAYLGPGIGGGALAATLGIVIAIFAVLFGLIWFPVKKLIKKRKEKKDHQLNKVD